MRGRVHRSRVAAVLTPGWVAAHVGMLVLVAAFLALGWWQVTRAAAGNLLSYGYALEWPAFAIFVIWVWAVELRKALRRAGEGAAEETTGEPAGEQAVRSEQPAPSWRRRPRNEAAYDDSDDPQLAAYNHYLAWLAANPHRSPADYPGLPDPTDAETAARPAAKPAAKEETSA